MFHRSAEGSPSVQKFATAAIKNLSPESCEAILASIREGAQAKNFTWAVGHDDGQLPQGGDVYLVRPGERFLAYRLKHSLIAFVSIILWYVLVGWQIGQFFWILCAICALHLAVVTVFSMRGGHDCTAAFAHQVRSRLQAAGIERDTSQFLGNLSRQ
jgi:hypothetical protein